MIALSTLTDNASVTIESLQKGGMEMTDYEYLLEEAADRNIKVREVPLIMYDGLTNGQVICIRSTMQTQAQKADVLAEEIAHTKLTVGNILDQGETGNRKQEYKARLKAYDKRIGLKGIVNAYRAGCKTLYEIAEYLHTEELFLSEALNCYREIYGESVSMDGYCIHFEPKLSVN